MCQFISFHHNPYTGKIAVYDLESHSNTEEKLKLDKTKWREGHYLPTGGIECRVVDIDPCTQREANARLKTKFPTFIKFFNYCLRKTNQSKTYGKSLDLRGLTSAEGLVLPKEIGGSLDLDGLTSAEGLVLPKEIGGWLYLSGLTSAKGLVLPKKIVRSLYLNGLTSAEGLVLPKEIGRSLYLNGLTSAKGLVLPKEIGGWIYLGGLNKEEKEKVIYTQKTVESK